MEHVLQSIWSPSTTLVFISVVLVSYIVLEYYQRPANYPPGPWRIPILGSTAMMSAFPLAALTKLGRKYGDVMSLPIGAQTWVVLGSAEATREAFQKNSEATSGRPRTTFYRVFSENGHGISLSDAPHMRMHKRFMRMALKNFGLGRNICEENINTQIRSLLDLFRACQGTPVDPRDLIVAKAYNVIALMTFGRHHHAEDPENAKYVEQILALVDLMMGASVGDAFPFLHSVPGDLCKLSAVRECFEYFKWYIGKQIQLHREDGMGPEDEPKDYIDAFLRRENELGDAAEENAFTDKQLIHTVFQINAGGIDTSSNTILFGLLFLLHYPEVQKRIANELAGVFPGDMSPTMRLRTRCPYTEAFLLEVQRHAPVVPLGMQHRVKEPITIGPYSLPTNTILMANYWAINHDERVWKNPNEFDPGNFLDDAGKLDPKPKVFFPFAIGARACPGDQMAKMEIFLFITNILKNFHVGLPPGDSLPPTRGMFGIVYAAHPFKVIFTPREVQEE